MCLMISNGRIIAIFLENVNPHGMYFVLYYDYSIVSIFVDSLWIRYL